MKDSVKMEEIGEMILSHAINKEMDLGENRKKLETFLSSVDSFDQINKTINLIFNELGITHVRGKDTLLDSLTNSLSRIQGIKAQNEKYISIISENKNRITCLEEKLNKSEKDLEVLSRQIKIENNINEDKQTLHMEEEEKHFETKEEKLKNALSQLQTTDMSALEDFFQEQNYNLDKEYEIQNNNETTSSKNNNCKEEEEESCLLEIAPFEEDKKEQINKNKDNGKELLIENSKQNKEEEDLSFDFLKSDKNNEEDISFDFLPKTDSNFEFKSNKQEKPCVETSNLEKFFESHEELCTHTYETKKLSKPQESLQTTQKIKEPNNFDEFQFLQEEPTQKTTKNEKTKKPEQQDKNQQKYTNNQTNQQMFDSFGFLVLDESRQIP